MCHHSHGYFPKDVSSNLQMASVSLQALVNVPAPSFEDMRTLQKFYLQRYAFLWDGSAILHNLFHDEVILSRVLAYSLPMSTAMDKKEYSPESKTTFDFLIPFRTLMQLSNSAPEFHSHAFAILLGKRKYFLMSAASIAKALFSVNRLKTCFLSVSSSSDSPLHSDKKQPSPASESTAGRSSALRAEMKNQTFHLSKYPSSHGLCISQPLCTHQNPHRIFIMVRHDPLTLSGKVMNHRHAEPPSRP